jgi:LmbE family N-acetylglucosaminyl deacetylase
MKTGLVVAAHPGDFVWRAGGAIALHAKRGYHMKIVCLSFGERGESQFAWKEKGATLTSVKEPYRETIFPAREPVPTERTTIIGVFNPGAQSPWRTT